MFTLLSDADSSGEQTIELGNCRMSIENVSSEKHTVQLELLEQKCTRDRFVLWMAGDILVLFFIM